MAPVPVDRPDLGGPRPGTRPGAGRAHHRMAQAFRRDDHRKVITVDVARHAVIAGVHNTRQARRLEGETSTSLMVQAIAGALDATGLTLSDVDGISAGA